MTLSLYSAIEWDENEFYVTFMLYCKKKKKRYMLLIRTRNPIQWFISSELGEEC